MKNYLLSALLFLVASFSVSCVATRNQVDFGVKSLGYEESVSYSVTALSPIKNKKMHVGEGMAVVVAMLGDKCILATAKHVVQNAESILIAPLDGRLNNRAKIEAKVVYTDGLEDVAFLSFATNYNHIAPKVILDEAILIGKSVIAFKYPSDYGYQIARGQIFDFWRLPDNKEVMVARMSTGKGFSGSGVFDANGNLAGLVSGKAADKRVDVAYLISGPRIAAAFQRFL